MTLKQARLLLGLSRQKLSQLSGVNTTTIYDLEIGRNANPSHDTVVRLVRALKSVGLKGITADELFPVDQVSA